MWSSLPLLSSVSAWALYVGAAAAAVSVAASLISTVTATRASDISNRQANEKISEANARAAEAIQESQRLKLEVEKERIERLRLEARLVPRRLSAIDQQKISDIIKNDAFFNKVMFVTAGFSPECIDLVNDFKDVFANSGFETVKSITEIAPSQTYYGVNVGMSSGDKPADGSVPLVIAELVEALSTMGLAAVPPMVNLYDDVGPACIALRIGHKSA